MARAGKGSQFERDVCYALSDWWESGRQDLFWRTATSGGRAKRRGRQGKTTSGHYGDICSTDPCTKALVGCICLELKKGYKDSSFADVIDRTDNSNAKGQFPFEAMLQQTIESWEHSGSLYWMLLFYRHMREPLAFMPKEFYRCLKDYGCFTKKPIPFVEFQAVIREKHKLGPQKYKTSQRFIEVVGVRWKDWLKEVTPKIIKTIWRER